MPLQNTLLKGGMSAFKNMLRKQVLHFQSFVLKILSTRSSGAGGSEQGEPTSDKLSFIFSAYTTNMNSCSSHRKGASGGSACANRRLQKSSGTLSPQ